MSEWLPWGTILGWITLTIFAGIKFSSRQAAFEQQVAEIPLLRADIASVRERVDEVGEKVGYITGILEEMRNHG